MHLDSQEMFNRNPISTHSTLHVLAVSKVVPWEVLQFICAQPPLDFQTYLRSCTVLLSFLLLRYIVSGSDLFADHALCLWGEKLGAILAKQRSNQVTTHILLPSLLASITGGQIPCRSVSLRTRLLQYRQLTLKYNRNQMETKTNTVKKN